MSRKSKGINAERDLIHKFWKKGWAAIRAAGSGSMKYPCPDVIASNGKERIALECKTSKEKHKYLTKKEVRELLEFSIGFDAKPYIAIRFNNTPWCFIRLGDLRETDESYMVNEEVLQKYSIGFDELINKNSDG